MSNPTILSEFQKCLSSASLVVDKIIADGHIHRCPVEGRPNGLDGSYKAHLDRPASIWWCNWVTGDTGTWTEKIAPLSKEQREAMRQNIQALKAAYESRRVNAQSAAAKAASIILRDTLQASDSHPYLQKKKVPAFYGVHEGTHGELIIPLQDVEDQIKSLQFISSAGKKCFFKGGALTGSFFRIPAKEEGGPLLIAEGYATAASVHLATGFEVWAAFTAMNLKAVGLAARKQFPEREIVLCADNDCLTQGNPGLTKATEAAKAVNGIVAVPHHEGRKCDFNDLHQWQSLEAVQEAIEKARKGHGEPRQKEDPKSTQKPCVPFLHCVTAHDFLNMSFPERRMLLSPILPCQGLCMLHAARGIGKTFIALSVAYAVASGGKLFDRWQAPNPAPVLFLDGEMPAKTLQDRLASIIAGTTSKIPDRNYLRILTPDMQKGPMPNIATREGQAAIEPFLEGVSLVILDNLATLARFGRSNDEESWLPVQGWLLELRRRGLSVLMIHHQGKGGDQRGTSAKEDILDTVISLNRPQDYNPEQGARFEVHLTKARGIYGKEANPFEAQLHLVNKTLVWVTRDIEDVDLEQLRTLLAEGYSIREAAEEMGKSKGAIQRLKKKLELL